MGLDTFNKRSRPFIFRKLTEEQFDLLVIGGGITGASVFRDAALRGMRVALVEARDFASATSGRSSKLIHGGLRYIKNLGLGLAWESCHERNLHIRLNKRLVRPLPFLVPLYRDRGEPRWLMRLGMLAYEALSGFNNYRFHKFLNREETLSLAPALPAKGLTGGCLYYDALINDSRWTMEVLKDGVTNGGLAVNYAPVTQLLHKAKQVVGVRIHDELSGSDYDIRTRVVANATGIFADRIRQLDGHNAVKRRLSKGTHLVFAKEDVPLSTTIVFSSPLDGRSLFLAKHEECFLFGTSDHWEEASPDLPVPAPADVDYLLTSLNRFMPEAQLDRSKVQFVYSGFRPLLSNSQADSSSVTREDHIEVSPSGLVSVVGGKLTTARITAARVLDRVMKMIGRDPAWSDCKTDKVSIGGTNEAVAESLAYWVRRCPKLNAYFRVLYQRYGLDANEICAQIQENSSDSAAEPIRAEVQYVCRHEMVCTLEDLIDRRAGFLYWNVEKRLERLRYGTQVIRTELDLTEAEFESQWLAYRDHLKRFHSLPDVG